MPLYWAGITVTRAVNSPQGQAIIDDLGRWAMATGATMLAIAGACWIFCDDEPKARNIHGQDINLPWEGVNPELCCEHPYAQCGLIWECSANPV